MKFKKTIYVEAEPYQPGMQAGFYWHGAKTESRAGCKFIPDSSSRFPGYGEWPVLQLNGMFYRINDGDYIATEKGVKYIIRKEDIERNYEPVITTD